MSIILNYPPDPQSPCPRNNFGLGEDYQFQNESEREALTRKWNEWDTEFPDDPAGDEYIQRYNERLAEISQGEPAQEIKIQPVVLKPGFIKNPIPEPVKNPNRIPLGRPRTYQDRDTCYVRIIMPVEMRNAIGERGTLEGRSISEIVRELVNNWLLKG